MTARRCEAKMLRDGCSCEAMCTTATCRYIEELITAEAAAGVPSSRVVVAGFSQVGSSHTPAASCKLVDHKVTPLTGLCVTDCLFCFPGWGCRVHLINPIFTTPLIGICVAESQGGAVALMMLSSSMKLAGVVGEWGEGAAATDVVPGTG